MRFVTALKYTFNRTYMIESKTKGWYFRLYPNPGFNFRLFGWKIHYCRKHGWRIT